MTAEAPDRATRSPLHLFADHWDDPPTIESRLRQDPRETLAEYGIDAPREVELRLAVNEPGLFNLRILLDVEVRPPFWEIGALTTRMAGILFSFTHCPVRNWCDGGLEFATPRYQELMDRCRRDADYLRRFQTSPAAELTAAGIPIPSTFRINVRICDRHRQYIVLIAPRGRDAAADLRRQIERLEQEPDGTDRRLGTMLQQDGFKTAQRPETQP